MPRPSLTANRLRIQPARPSPGTIDACPRSARPLAHAPVRQTRAPSIVCSAGRIEILGPNARPKTRPQHHRAKAKNAPRKTQAARSPRCAFGRCPAEQAAIKTLDAPPNRIDRDPFSICNTARKAHWAGNQTDKPEIDRHIDRKRPEHPQNIRNKISNFAFLQCKKNAPRRSNKVLKIESD